VLVSFPVALQNVRVICWVFACFFGASVRAANFYVSPAGDHRGNGSPSRPWDLQTALNQPSAVRPGDTIWLRGGEYRPASSSLPGFTSQLGGGDTAPIVVRQYPGERAILREATGFTGPKAARQTILYVFGSNTWFWGFDVAGSGGTRVVRVPGPDPTLAELPLPSGVEVVGTNIKLINLTVHDARGGLGLWAAAVNCEVSGCIVYNNGWAAPDRGHGHGIYTQNLNGTKRLSDNIVFNHFGLGIHGYTVHSFLQNYLIERNVVFDNAHFASYPDVDAGEQILFGGGTRIKNLRILNNDLYQPLNLHGSMLTPDYGDAANVDATVTGNYIAGGSGGGNCLVSARSYDSLVFTDNTLYSTNGDLVQLRAGPGYTVDHNTYYGTVDEGFRNGRGRYDFAEWQTATGLDAHSRFFRGTRPPNKVFVNVNAYEPKRANIIVYNWSLASRVRVNVSRVLSDGDIYEVRNAQDYFAPPVVTGTYKGELLRLPMINLTVAIPHGWTDTSAVPRTGPEFNVFVLIGRRPTPKLPMGPSETTSYHK